MNKKRLNKNYKWIKTNPQPLNSKTNYLTNCREIALLGVKGGKPTFNSKYDNGIYKYPIQGGKIKFHPTQKNLKLFSKAMGLYQQLLGLLKMHEDIFLGLLLLAPKVIQVEQIQLLFFF